MTKRRGHSIQIAFHDDKFSSIHWSPFRECWPKSVLSAVENLKTMMTMAVKEGVTDE